MRSEDAVTDFVGPEVETVADRVADRGDGATEVETAETISEEYLFCYS